MLCPRRTKTALLFVMGFIWLAAQGSSAQAAGRISYDSQCLTIDGKDQIIFSGAFHYFRCPRELWADRFRTLKQGGFNTLETYAAWNYHELTPPSDPDDFSKLNMTDLHDWLAMAIEQFGFNVILRPGPYICAEWDGGGYPQWLLAKRPVNFKPREWYRSDDPTYLAWSKHWYTAVAKVAAPFQITHRPVGKSGIILWQIENEYDYSDQPVQVKHHQLDFLAHASRDLGIDIPLTTCLTDNRIFRQDTFLKDNVIETRNTYPKFDLGAMWRDVGMLYDYQPEKFKMITELQGGWFAQVGGELSEQQGFDQTHINNITLNAWENGFTSTNYYMGFGGTNFGDWAAQRLTTTYDYDAPVRECGGVGPRYLAVKALGQFISDHGAILARSIYEKFNVISKTDSELHVALRRGSDGSRFLFLRNENQGNHLAGTVVVTTTDADPVQIRSSYDLGSFGAKVLYLPPGVVQETGGDWYPKPQSPPQRPTDLPAPIQITDIRQKIDAGPSQWQPFDPKLSEAQAGVFNRQYVFYRTTIPTADSKTSGDARILMEAKLSAYDWAGAAVGGDFRSAVSAGRLELGHPSAAQAQLVLLYDNAGRPNFGDDLEQPTGLLNPRLGLSKASARKITGWKEKHIDHNDRSTDPMGADFDDSQWSPANVDADSGDLDPWTAAIYRASIDLTAAELRAPHTLTLGRVDDIGQIYVNGQKIGESHEWSQVQRFAVTEYLHAGKNSIVVRVVNNEGGGGLSMGVELEPVAAPLPTKWEFSQLAQGVAGNWSSAALDDSDWKQSAGPDQQVSLLTWYRMKFELPEPKPSEWIPWRLTLSAKGDGFLFLNGHPLGRWWEQGPQHDFFLPECWLNFGPGRTNVITAEMRPTDAPSCIIGASVSPYPDMAEIR